MKFARFSKGPVGAEISYGVLEGTTVEEISSTPFLPWERTGITHEVAEVRLLAPCLPSKIVAIGVNYKDHAAEMGRELPDVPVAFFKPSTSVIGPDDEVMWPQGSENVSFEGELAVVAGAVARRVKRGDWKDVILGYTCALDMTARDFQAVDLQWARAKGFDTSGPLGPFIETDLDPSNLGIKTTVNGDVKQDARTDQLIFGVPEIIEFVTSYITLLPGDVVLTGTPSGVGPVADGDIVEVEIEGIGKLGVRIRGPKG